MAESVLQLDARDNVLVALASLTARQRGPFRARKAAVWCEAIPAKHKMALVDLARATGCGCTAWWWARVEAAFRAAGC